MTKRKPIEEHKKDWRPPLYTKELAGLICAQLAMGKSLRSVCKQDWIPCLQTIFSWFRVYPEFLEQYTIAKQESADALVEEIMDIADDWSNDWMESNDPNNPWYKFNNEHYQRSRVRIDVRKWVASKMKPKKYGDKLAIGWDDSMWPVQVKIMRIWEWEEN